MARVAGGGIGSIASSTPLAVDMIRKGEVHELKPFGWPVQAAPQLGMQTFDQALYRLYSPGWKITYEAALAQSDSGQTICAC